MQKSFFSRFLVFFKHWFFISAFIFILNYNYEMGRLLSSWVLDLPLWQMAIDASVIILLAIVSFFLVLAPLAVFSRPIIHHALSKISAFAASAFSILFILRAVKLWLQQIAGTLFYFGLPLKIFFAAAVLVAVSALMLLKSCEPFRTTVAQGLDRLCRIALGFAAVAFVIVLISLPLFFLSSRSSQQIASTSPKPGKAAKNILLITFDALAARDMSLYGYRLDTTPNINEFAKSAVVFDHFYAQANWTFPNTTSLLTGTYPSQHRNYTYPYRYPRLTQPQNVLQRVLKEHGFYTVAAAANLIYGTPETIGADFGFDTIADKKYMADWTGMFRSIPLFALATYAQNPYTQSLMTVYRFFEPFLQQYFEETEYVYPIAPVFKYAQELMTARPFFIWIHLYPPHHPFLPPAPHKDLYCKNGCSTTAADERLFLYQKYPPDKQNIIDERRLRYDELIHYCDDEFGRLMKTLKGKGMLEDTMVILSSDHGESFEDGFFAHTGPFLWNQLIQIPCVIYMPGLQGKRLSVNAELIDLAPTILAALEIEKPVWMQGESLLPYMLGHKDRTDKPKYAMQLQANSRFDKKLSKGTAAVMLGPLKLIYEAETDKAQLYDLDKDPGEENDISVSNPEQVKQLKALIKKNIFHSESPST